MPVLWSEDLTRPHRLSLQTLTPASSSGRTRFDARDGDQRFLAGVWIQEAANGDSDSRSALAYQAPVELSTVFFP